MANHTGKWQCIIGTLSHVYPLEGQQARGQNGGEGKAKPCHSHWLVKGPQPGYRAERQRHQARRLRPTTSEWTNHTWKNKAHKYWNKNRITSPTNSETTESSHEQPDFDKKATTLSGVKQTRLQSWLASLVFSVLTSSRSVSSVDGFVFTPERVVAFLVKVWLFVAWLCGFWVCGGGYPVSCFSIYGPYSFRCGYVHSEVVGLNSFAWCPLPLCPCTQAGDLWQVSGNGKVLPSIPPFCPLPVDLPEG